MFKTRREVWTYLLENRDPTDRRDFVVPADLPLKLLTAAAFAAVDGDRMACDLLPEAEQAMAKFRDSLTVRRIRRLQEAAYNVCRQYG